jgi:hypothetical protein
MKKITVLAFGRDSRLFFVKQTRDFFFSLIFALVRPNIINFYLVFLYFFF